MSFSRSKAASFLRHLTHGQQEPIIVKNPYCFGADMWVRVVAMTKNKFPLFLQMTLIALLATDLSAQTIANFQATRQEVSGGETSVTNNACSMYSGLVNIASSGVISGTIIRQNFAAAATNSIPVSVTITNSRIFGPIVLENTFTNHESWGGGSGLMETEKIYSADFHLATTIPSFFVKGRANHRMLTTVTTNAWAGPGGGLPGATNKTTNYYRYVSLGGVSFNAGQTRGLFNAGGE